MQHDSTTFTVLNSKFPSKRTHQPADRISSLRQRHASSPFFGTSLRSFLSSLLLKLKRFGYFLFYYIFSSWRDFTLWSVVWFFFYLFVAVAELTPVISMCGKSTNSWFFEDPARISNPTWSSGCNYINRWVLVGGEIRTLSELHFVEVQFLNDLRFSPFFIFYCLLSASH